MSTPPQQRSHFGMAGHYAALSEFLLRGWNAAVPAVDKGDDALVLDDDDGTVRRVQVKTSSGKPGQNAKGPFVETKYTLSRRQLTTSKKNELCYMFMMRVDQRWRYILIRRDELDDLRQQSLAREERGPGRPPKADDDASGEGVTLTIKWQSTDAEGWGTSFARYLDTWSADFPELRANLPQPVQGDHLSPDL